MSGVIERSFGRQARIGSKQHWLAATRALRERIGDFRLWHLLPEVGTLLYCALAPGDWRLILLPVLIRILLAGSVALHGLAHALAAGSYPQWRVSAYRKALSPVGLLPFGPLPLPGLGIRNHPLPSLPVEDLTPKRLRLAAAAGPAANLAVFLTLLPMASSEPLTAAPLVDLLRLLAAVNLWLVLTSLSDYATLFSGRGGRLFCGNFGILAKRSRQDQGFLPARFAALARRIGEATDIRGQQAGGIAVLAANGHFLGRKIVNDKRGNLTTGLLRAFRRRAAVHRLTGARPLRNIFHMVAHYRYGTSSGPSEIETHWHRWSSPRKKPVWCVEERRLVLRKRIVDNLITHNGDFDAWLTPQLRLDHVQLGQWLAGVLGERNAAEGDSPKIAGMMDLLLTQGQWEASLRLAYAFQTGQALPAQSLKYLSRLFERLFSDWEESAREPDATTGDRLRIVGCTSLSEVFVRNPVAIKALVDKLRQASFAATRDWPEETKRRRARFVSQAVQAFFCNDLNEAMRLFMDRAEGTFGLVATTSLQPGAVTLAADRQPLFVATDPETGLMAYASEAAALKVACPTSGSRDKTSDRLAYRFDLRDGDIVLIQVREGTADNTMTILSRRTNNVPVTARITPELLAESANDSDSSDWIALSDNPYLTAVPEPGADRVLEEMTAIPAVLARIQQDWDLPSSLNRRTANNFCAQLFSSEKTRSSRAGQTAPPRPNRELDLLVLGVENSYYLANRFAEDLRLFFPFLRAEAVDAVAYCEDPRRYAVGAGTITLAISHSGQTFNTVDAVKFIQALHDLGKAGPVFAMTGEIDTPLAAAVEQSLKAGAPWRERLFVTNAGWRTAEPATLSSAAIHATLTQLLLRLAREGQTLPQDRKRPFGLVADNIDVCRMDGMARWTISRAAALVGRTAEGWAVETEERNRLLKEGRYLAGLLTEPAVAFIFTALHLFLMLWLGWNPVIGVGDALHTVFGWSIFDTNRLGGNLLLVGGETAYFLFAGVGFTLAMRKLQGRPLWDRVFVGRTLLIGDEPYVKDLLLQYVSKLFSQAYEFSGFAAIHAADSRSGNLLHVYGHRVTRGLLLFIGLPDGRWPGRERTEAAVHMTCSQARSVKNLGTGATVIGIGQNPASACKVDRYLLMGGAGHEQNAHPWRALGDWSELAGRLQESRFAAFERLLASYVIFHTTAATARDFMNRLVPLANLLWTPIFWTVRLLTGDRIRPTFGYWDLSRTQSGTLITTTAAPVPAIAMDPKAYRGPAEPQLQAATRSLPKEPSSALGNLQ